MIQTKHISVTNTTDLIPYFLAVTGSFLTKPFARFEYNFLNNSDTVRGEILIRLSL